MHSIDQFSVMKTHLELGLDLRCNGAELVVLGGVEMVPRPGRPQHRWPCQGSAAESEGLGCH